MSRVWWWHDSAGRWDQLPDVEDERKALRDLEEWTRVAPMALGILREIISGDEGVADQVIKFKTVQDTLLTAWGVRRFEPLGWREAFLYRTLTLDGRWLLSQYEVPVFNPGAFVALAASEWGWPLPMKVQDALRRHPLTDAMPELYVDGQVAVADPG